MFDLVMESAMFISLTDEVLAQQISSRNAPRYEDGWLHQASRLAVLETVEFGV